MMSPKNLQTKALMVLMLGAVATGAGYFWSQRAEQLGWRPEPAASKQWKTAWSDRAIADSRPWVRGLEGLQLDQWTAALQSRASFDSPFPDEARIAEQIGGIARVATGLGPMFDSIGSAGLAQRCAAPGDYLSLAGGLLRARAALQAPASSNPEGERPYAAKVILLETLAEETLYVASIVHPDAFRGPNRFFARSFPAAASTCPSRSVPLNGLSLCEGDVVTSKGGAGSSSLLARMSERPGNFSHSTIAYAMQGSGQPELRFVEAFIEDGVKLRRPDHDYRQDPNAPAGQESGKKKMYVYRYEGPNREQAIAGAASSLDALVAQMQKITNGHAEETRSFEYDFQMDATSDKQFFCSEIPYWVYKRGNVADRANPYDPALWSAISGPTRAFFESFLGIRNQKYPAPSDVNFNAGFGVVAAAYDPTRLEEDRIDVAMIDALIQAAGTPEGTRMLQDFLKNTEAVGNQPPTPADKARIVAAVAANDPRLAPQVAAALTNAPPNMTLKQLAFFAALDMYITPQLRARTMGRITSGPSRVIGPLKLRELVLSESTSLFTELMKRVSGAVGAGIPAQPPLSSR